MDNKKVLFITPSLCQGGIERSQILMLQMLDKKKYDLTLFLYGKDMTLLPLVPNEVRVIRDQIMPHYFRRPKAVLLNACLKLFSMLQMKKRETVIQEKLRIYIHEQKAKHPAEDYFSEEEFDVVVSNAIGICTEMALHIRAKRRVAWYRGSVDMHHEMLGRIFPEYDDIIAVSQGVKDMLTDAYPHVAEKIHVVNDYVSWKEVSEKANQDCAVTVPCDCLTICSCGRFTREKGFDLAVDAAAKLKGKGRNFKWFFVGDGADRPQLESQIKKENLQNDIFITGFMDNPFPVMKACNIYVQPSYEEAFGRTIKEALILGKPIVSTDTVGAREILGKSQYGLITKIDADSIADGIEKSQYVKLDSYTKEANLSEKRCFEKALEYYLS